MSSAAASATIADIVRAMFLLSSYEPQRRLTTDIAARTILRSVWLHYHLHTAILFVVKRPVHLRRVVERHAMRHHKRRIDLARFDIAQQTREVLVDVCLAGLDRQPLVHRGAKGKLVDHAAVYAWHRHRSALAARINGLAQRAGSIRRHEGHGLDLVVEVINVRSVRLHANRIDAGVGTDAAGHVPQLVEHVGIHRIDRLCATLVRHDETLRYRVDRDHATSAEQERAPDGELANGTAAP